MKCVQIEKEITKIKLKNKTKKKQMEISAGLKVESPYTSYCPIVSFFLTRTLQVLLSWSQFSYDQLHNKVTEPRGWLYNSGTSFLHWNSLWCQYWLQFMISWINILLWRLVYTLWELAVTAFNWFGLFSWLQKFSISTEYMIVWTDFYYIGPVW